MTGQLIITSMSNIKEVHGKPRLRLCQPIIWSMAAMLRDSGVAVAVMHTHLRRVSLAIISMRQLLGFFPFLIDYRALFAALRAAGAPL